MRRVTSAAIASDSFVPTTAVIAADRLRSAEGRRTTAMAQELGLLIEGATNYAIYMLDPDGLVTVWNRGAERIKGWAEQEVLGRSSALFYTPEDILAGRPVADLDRASSEGRFEQESWRVRKDGSEFLASVTITALRDDTGTLLGFGKVIRDITDQRAAENAVARREDHLRSILATVPDAMIVMDERGIISSFSAAAERLFDIKEERLVGQDVGVLIVGDDFRDVSDRGKFCRLVPVRQATGIRYGRERFPIELAVGEASIGGERIFTCFIRDLTKRRETEQRVEDLQAELLHIARLSAMGTMASTLAHEINQPLTAIANYLEATSAMIGQSSEPQAAQIGEALDLAAAQSLRAGAIVRRLRSFVESGEAGVRAESLPLLLDEATSLGLLGAQEAGIDVSMSMAAGVGKVMVDRVQIQQVLINLIRNAIDSMAPSPVKRLAIHTAFDRNGWVRVTVADTGTGIDPAMADHLFEAFSTTKSDGMGLGLSICRTIIEAHGGRIWAEAGDGAGTAFSFCIPVAEDAA